MQIDRAYPNATSTSHQWRNQQLWSSRGFSDTASRPWKKGHVISQGSCSTCQESLGETWWIGMPVVSGCYGTSGREKHVTNPKLKHDPGFDISKESVLRTFCTKRSAIFASLLDFQKIKGVIKLMSWLCPSHWIFPRGFQLHSKILRCWRLQCCCPITWRICPESRIKAVKALMTCMTTSRSQSPFQNVRIILLIYWIADCQVKKIEKKMVSFWFHDRMQLYNHILSDLVLPSGHQGWAPKKGMAFNRIWGIIALVALLDKVI